MIRVVWSSCNATGTLVEFIANIGMREVEILFSSLLFSVLFSALMQQSTREGTGVVMDPALAGP